MEDLKELRKTAEAATPGPWTAETHCAYTEDKYHAVYSVDAGDSPVISQLGCGCCDDGLEVSKSDAAFVTAFNPETALALLSRLEQAEQAVARVRELHQPVEIEPSETICRTCSTQRGAGQVLHYSPYIEYPCDTIRALDGDGRG